MSDMSKCCTCGYEWRTGQNGSHSCSEYLLKIIGKDQERIKELESALIQLIHSAGEFVKWKGFESCDLDSALDKKELDND